MSRSLNEHQFMIVYKSSWEEFHKARNDSGVHPKTMMNRTQMYSHEQFSEFINSVKDDLGLTFTVDEKDSWAVKIEDVGFVTRIYWPGYHK